MNSELLRFASTTLASLLNVKDQSTTEEIAKYLISIPNLADKRAYLEDLLGHGDPSALNFVVQLQDRCDRLLLPPGSVIYQKDASGSPQKGNNRSTQQKKQSNQQQAGAKSQPLQVAASVQTFSPTKPDALVPPVVAQPQTKHAGKKTKFVNLMSNEGQERMTELIPGRHECECLASRHALVNNCMQCGRIVCTQEGSGPCFFCGTLVCTPAELETLHRDSRKSDKLREKLMSQGHDAASIMDKARASFEKISGKEDAFRMATEHKDRLLQYDRTSARRTKVIDDQTDYFNADSNRWLSSEERAAVKAKEEKIRAAKEHAKRTMTVTIDFAGRRVLLEDPSQNIPDLYDDSEEVDVQHLEQVRSQIDALRLQAGIANTINEAVSIMPQYVTNKKHPVVSAKPLSTTGISRIQDADLSSMSDTGSCLSMHQPYASLLIKGVKMHEGRVWYSDFRGRLWIAAAAKQTTDEEIAEIEGFYENRPDVVLPPEYPVSCLLGCVDVVDCLSQEDYRIKYPNGDSAMPFVFICENPQELVVRFPIKGQHKIWHLPKEVHDAAKRGLRL